MTLAKHLAPGLVRVTSFTAFLLLMSCTDFHPSDPGSLTPGAGENVTRVDPEFTSLSVLPPIVTSASSPNEPSTYIRFAENDLTSLPKGLSVPSLAGIWYNYPYTDPDLTVVQTTSLPRSSVKFLSTRFPAGLRASVAPVNFGGWDASKRTKSKVYMSVWMRLRGATYENQAAGTKIGFLSYGKPSTSTANQGFLFLNGYTQQGAYSSFHLKFVQQGHIARNLYQNVDSRRLVTAGPWHRIETLYEINTIGQANGKMKVWVDGILIMDYADVEYINAAYPVKFNYWKWNPTWGGTAGTRTRTDYIDIDHVYMSGLP